MRNTIENESAYNDNHCKTSKIPDSKFRFNNDLQFLATNI